MVHPEGMLLRLAKSSLKGAGKKKKSSRRPSSSKGFPEQVKELQKNRKKAAPV